MNKKELANLQKQIKKDNIRFENICLYMFYRYLSSSAFDALWLHDWISHKCDIYICEIIAMLHDCFGLELGDYMDDINDICINYKYELDNVRNHYESVTEEGEKTVITEMDVCYYEDDVYRYVCTYQNNNWIRLDTYHWDGTTETEILGKYDNNGFLEIRNECLYGFLKFR